MTGTARRLTPRRATPLIARFVHWHDHGGSAETGEFRTTRIALATPPVATVLPAESIMHGGWLRSPSYPVGRLAGTVLA